MDRFVGIGDGDDFGALADREVGDIGLVHEHFGINALWIGYGHQRRTGDIGRTGDGGFADLDVETGDDAVDGRDDPRLAQLIVDLFELRLGLGQPLAGGFEIDPRQFQLVAHDIELFLAHQAALVETARARELPLEIFYTDLLAFDIDGVQAH